MGADDVTGSDDVIAHDVIHGEYPIAQVDFDHVSLHLIITVTVLTVTAAKTIFHFFESITKIVPESCLLIILGIALGSLGHLIGVKVTMDENLFFLVLLPPIVFDAGYFMPVRPYFSNIGTILIYAVIGTLWNTASIGVILYLGQLAGWYKVSMNLLHCLTFSALISAVDPVAVLAVFEEIHVDEVLYILVFGESLLNDAVTVVVYHMMHTFGEIGQENLEVKHYFSGVANFLVVAFGGTGIGLLFGLVASLVSKHTAHVRTLEPLFVFGFAYLSYVTAELFHFSGILAIVHCGLVMSQYVEKNMSHKSHTTVKYFLKMLSSVSEAIIFAFLGFVTINTLNHIDLAFICLTLVSCLVCRFIGTYVLTYFANIRRTDKLDFAQKFIMAYGGIRGAVAFCLAASLDERIIGKDRKELMEATTLITIFFTVFFQGTTIKPLVKLFNIKTTEGEHKRSMNETISARVLDHLMSGVEDITGLRGDNWMREMYHSLNNKYFIPLLLRENPETQEDDLMRRLNHLEIQQSIAEITNRNSCSKISRTESNSFKFSESTTQKTETDEETENAEKDDLADEQIVNATKNKEVMFTRCEPEIPSKEDSDLKLMFNAAANRRRSNLKANRQYTQSRHLVPAEKSELNLKILEMQQLQKKVKENHHAGRYTSKRFNTKEKRSQSYDLSRLQVMDARLERTDEVDEEGGITIIVPQESNF